MQLGEPDASGRRAPKPVEGKTETLPVDTVILAIGQKVDAAGLPGLELTRKGGVVYDKKTFRTSLPKPLQPKGLLSGGGNGAYSSPSMPLQPYFSGKGMALSMRFFPGAGTFALLQPCRPRACRSISSTTMS